MTEENHIPLEIKKRLDLFSLKLFMSFVFNTITPLIEAKSMYSNLLKDGLNPQDILGKSNFILEPLKKRIRNEIISMNLNSLAGKVPDEVKNTIVFSLMDMLSSTSSETINIIADEMVFLLLESMVSTR